MELKCGTVCSMFQSLGRGGGEEGNCLPPPPPPPPPNPPTNLIYNFVCIVKEVKATIIFLPLWAQTDMQLIQILWLKEEARKIPSWFGFLPVVKFKKEEVHKFLFQIVYKESGSLTRKYSSSQHFFHFLFRSVNHIGSLLQQWGGGNTECHPVGKFLLL